MQQNPYGFILEEGDIMVISTSREQLTSILSQKIGSIETFDENDGDKNTKNQIITEVMILPLFKLDRIQLKMELRYRYNCFVIGLQRKSEIITSHVSELPLEPGDALLIEAKSSIKALEHKVTFFQWSRQHRDIFKDISKISIYFFISNF